jgi:hypothetical protein
MGKPVGCDGDRTFEGDKGRIGLMGRAVRALGNERVERIELVRGPWGAVVACRRNGS